MNIDEQVALLMQGTEYGDEALKQAMAAELRERLIEAQQEGRPLRVYCGYDPRKADLHLGHTVTMRKLRQFQDLGHEVTFLIGNFTSLIGDPSDKDKLRPRLTPEEIEENARTYAEQAFRILDPTKTKIRYNAEWLSKLCLADMIPLAANFTLQQFLTRENFRLRWERGDPIYLHETFYAIMQGYDAYMLKADVQVGGTDQLFNIVTAARKIMTFLGAKPNIAIIMGILPGTDGVVKMSKSLGNHIPINTTAEDMYGKVMSIPDFVMPTYAKLVTRWLPDEVAAFEKALADGTLHPRDAKMKLAFEITANFYGEEAAQRAQEAFVRLFQKRDLPEEIPEFHAEAGQSVLDVLVNAQLVKSKSEGRRLIEQKGVRLDGQVLTEPNAPIPHPGVLQVGKRQFLKVVF
ncbi:tyrosine--tRNA ligase [Thermanaerothrix sp. 4228-RoL]|uniref:Tyrosine--tRNA ligase n=1 Tax=Thermanaerothrix solaris TaxID=3058434 RepID=A0ABU3NQM7_9CHLR|nr:tyrosine--tRNA ligase [Thermanaerothrix sp. 4228-RoL]MDT8899116.1 tyrosine--tRNA ligase [Thermanaerothrix sp. 4228-RoL]